MSITRTVVCNGKTHHIRGSGYEFSAYFSSPESENTAPVADNEPRAVSNHTHIEGLTREEWDALIAGHSYTLTIGD